MNTVTSTDGTKIAYDAQGKGPAVILVDGALSTRQGKAELAELLAPRFTVYGYDRRGRADSGDTRPYAVAREIEDLETLIDAFAGYDSGHTYTNFVEEPMETSAAFDEYTWARLRRVKGDYDPENLFRVGRPID